MVLLPEGISSHVLNLSAVITLCRHEKTPRKIIARTMLQISTENSNHIYKKFQHRCNRSLGKSQEGVQNVKSEGVQNEKSEGVRSERSEGVRSEKSEGVQSEKSEGVQSDNLICRRPVLVGEVKPTLVVNSVPKPEANACLQRPPQLFPNHDQLILKQWQYRGMMRRTTGLVVPRAAVSWRCERRST